MIRDYLLLTKPGIVRGNAITAAAGFFLASKGQPDFLLLLAMLAGLCFVIASACVINNIFDRRIDALMKRTKNRALVTGSVSQTNAAIFAAGMGILGFGILYFLATLPSLLTAFLGWFVYVAIYTPLKPKTVYTTIIGGVSGATPPVAGYTAVTNNFDLASLLLFIILVLWQMPHFYAIGIYRLDEYRAASIPVLPAARGINRTKKSIFYYIIAFLAAALSLTFFGYTGYFYLIIILLAGLYWLKLAYTGFSTDNDQIWAKKVFRVSLLVLLLFSIMISINSVV